MQSVQSSRIANNKPRLSGLGVFVDTSLSARKLSQKSYEEDQRGFYQSSSPFMQQEILRY